MKWQHLEIQTTAPGHVKAVMGKLQIIKVIRHLILAPVVGVVLIAGARAESPTERSLADLVTIDNGQVRVGVKRSSGAGIAFICLSSDGKNFINHWDRGRLVQQSYYGEPDGSMWDKQPWRWNPVQGGDWRGHPARLLDLQHTSTTLKAKSVGKHWASGADLDDVTFEENITLSGTMVHIGYKMTYSGTKSHPKTTHELPAVFLEPEYDTLLVYQGDKPWTGAAVSTSKPGWPNESRKFSEHWAAYVDKDGRGIGAYVPTADKLTCYRFGDGGRNNGSCSYFAPLKEFAITPGLVFEYDVWFAIDSGEEIRKQFADLRK